MLVLLPPPLLCPYCPLWKKTALTVKLFGQKTPHEYKIIRYAEDEDVFTLRAYLPPSNEIAFESYDSSVVIPSPFLLSVHARVGKIINVSGLGEVLDEMMYNYSRLPSQIDPGGSTEIGTVLAGKLLILT